MDIVYLYFSKVFNIVSQEIFIVKLTYELDECVVMWTENWLNHLEGGD